MSDLKITDRRWWAREQSDNGELAADEPKLKPSYVEELEQKIAAKDEEIARLIGQNRSASAEFDEARARLRKEISKDVERSRRQLIVSFLEVLDNLDRALEAAPAAGDSFVTGVAMVRQQFLSTLEGLGVRRLDPLNQPFDPALHEAVTTVPATDAAPTNTIIGVIRPGYLIGDEVLRPAAVAVAQ
jgi:molecular chaperone GrpE